MDNNQHFIPKIIHYCWFGRQKIPENLQKNIETWRDKMPEYEIIEWNEDNFDINSSVEYVKEAYAAQKYAFVSDYVRLKVLYEQGGIYLDTDIEMLKSPEVLLENASLVTGFEMPDNLITAFIASERGNLIIREFLEQYKIRHFVQKDGTYDQTPINDKFTELMMKYGLRTDNSRQSLENGVEIYPYVVFCGQNIKNAHPQIEENTYTVHRFQASWKKANFFKVIKYKIVVPFVQKIIGYEQYDRLKKLLHM